MTLDGKVALVTGAAGDGMGRSIALTLAREGAAVVINYRTHRAPAEAIVAHIEAQGGRALSVHADVFEVDACQRLVEMATAHFGQLDICIINPGGGWNPQPLEQIRGDDVMEAVRRELAPLYNLLPLLLPAMNARKWGRFIALGLCPPFNSPDHVYNVGKAARTAAVQVLRQRVAGQGVTVNTIAPSDTPGFASLAEAIEQCAHGPSWQQRTHTTPQDIAEGAAFLCSDAGAFLNGMVLAYD